MSLINFIPKIWSARLTAHLDNSQVASIFFNRDYEGEISDHGDTVKINQIGDVSIFEYVRNQDMPAPEELSGVAQELVIDMSDAFNFQIDDIDKAQTKPKLMNDAMKRAAYKLADTSDKRLFTKLSEQAGNVINNITIVTPNDAYDLLVQLRVIMAKKNVPSIGRRVAVPPELVGMMLKDKRFTATGSPPSEERLKSGFITRAVGFDIYESNNLVEDDATGSIDIIAGHEIGATYANQISKIEAYRIEKRFGDGMKGLSLSGAKVTIPQAFVRARTIIQT